MSLSALARRWKSLASVLLLLTLLPVGCAQLAQKERELVFRIEPGAASWYHGRPAGVQVLDLTPDDFDPQHSLQAWWWPAARADAPTLLYLHGSRWNLTGQLFRIEQWHALGFSVLAVDYRGFGESRGPLPSEGSVYQDAQIAWQRLQQLQPDPARRYVYGHSLGGAIAVDLTRTLSAEGQAPAGLIVESSFTNLGDAAEAVVDTRLPIRWLLSQRFDSLDKIAEVGVPLLIVHGTQDRYVPARFSEQLFERARPPKRLLLVPGGSHNNALRLGRQDYRQALRELFGLG